MSNHKRKVQTPNERAPEATQDGVNRWIVPQKITALCVEHKVRVKMCGKSAQIVVVILLSGKPCLEQDKVCMYGGFVPI